MLSLGGSSELAWLMTTLFLSVVQYFNGDPSFISKISEIFELVFWTCFVVYLKLLLVCSMAGIACEVSPPDHGECSGNFGSRESNARSNSGS